jgi:hypothetical protein
MTMDYTNLDIVDIKEITDENELAALDAKLLDYLKKEGIIKKPVKSKTTDKHELLENEENYKKIIDSNHFKIISSRGDLENLEDGDPICIKGIFDHICFKMSPAVKIIGFEGLEIPLSTQFLDKNVIFDKGFVKYKGTEKLESTDEIVDFFNKLISVYNILNIPLDFIHDYELITYFKTSDGNFFSMLSSQKAHSRGTGYKIIKMRVDEFGKLGLAVNFIWKAIKKSETLNSGDIFVFLGYGRYYHFHNDYLTSFANSWMFVEAIIGLMWDKMMFDNGFSNNYLKQNSRNWTLQIKIDELLLKGYINEEIKNQAHKLRTKRNKVFHVSKDPDIRKIDSTISEECINLGLYLFYENIDLLDSGYIIGFDDFASAIKMSIHQNPASDQCF